MTAKLSGLETPHCVGGGCRRRAPAVAWNHARPALGSAPCTTYTSPYGCQAIPYTIPVVTRRRCCSTAASAAAAETAAAAGAPPLTCEVQQASTAVELRAAAFLRAISFYTYPPGRSEFAARSHRLMKANAEWDSVTAKIEGRDVAFRDLDVTCYIAAVQDADVSSGSSDGGASAAHDDLLAALRSSLDDSAQLPAEPSSDLSSRPGRLAVGSLDLNVGHTLPSEELIGRQPQADPRRRRAYLSNVCVAPAARRLGVARALLRHAEDAARRAGVEWLYVHVVADNAPAVALYCEAMGFQVEHAESEGYARSLQRPRRLLLAKCLAGQSA